MRGEAVRAQDQINLERGYYEGLLSEESSFARLLRHENQLTARAATKRDADFPESTEKWMPTDDLREKVYRPSENGVTVGKPWSTNRWGLRDQDYPKEKADGVFRIAMLGASYTMGRGVGDGGNFESQLEERLNQRAEPPVEILNFATSNFTPLELVFVAERVIPAFDPDACYVVSHSQEPLRVARRLVTKVMAGSPLGYPFLEDLQRRARLAPGASEEENLRRIAPFAAELLGWSYRTIAAACEQNGIDPVWIFMPTTGRLARFDDDLAEVLPLAQDAGFRTVAPPRPFGGMRVEEIRIHPQDLHPNEKAHAVFAGRLLEALEEAGVLNRLEK
jgi:lysophospholipase L1-like esterase